MKTYIVEAKKFFEADAERLEKVNDGDLVLITIDHERRKADYTWFPQGENPANFPAEEEDYEAIEAILAII